MDGLSERASDRSTMALQTIWRMMAVTVPESGREAFRRDLPNVAMRAVVQGLTIALGVQLALHLGGDKSHAVWLHVAAHLGLLGSLFYAEFGRGNSPLRMLFRTEITARVLLGCVGFSAGLGHLSGLGTATIFTLLVCMASTFNALSQPFIGTIYGMVYDTADRGRIVAYTRMIHGLVAVAAGYGLGLWLGETPEAFQIIYPLAGVLGIGATWFFCSMPTTDGFRVAGSKHRFSALAVLWNNRQFGRFQLFQFILGFANLGALPILAVYVKDVMNLSIDMAVLIVGQGVLAQIVALLTVRLHGVLFDKIGVVWHRVLTSTMIGVGFLMWGFVGTDFYLGAVAAMLIGSGMAGGQIIWMIGSIYFAPKAEMNAYNSAHTFLTGLRGVTAPLVAGWVMTATPLAGNYSLFFHLVAITILLSALGHALFVRVPRNPAPLAQTTTT